MDITRKGEIVKDKLIVKNCAYHRKATKSIVLPSSLHYTKSTCSFNKQQEQYQNPLNTREISNKCSTTQTHQMALSLASSFSSTQMPLWWRKGEMQPLFWIVHNLTMYNIWNNALAPDCSVLNHINQELEWMHRVHMWIHSALPLWRQQFNMHIVGKVHIQGTHQQPIVVYFVVSCFATQAWWIYATQAISSSTCFQNQKMVSNVDTGAEHGLVCWIR